MSHYILNEDRTCTPCEMMDWAEQFEKINRNVAKDDIDDHRISTVFIGLDHNWLGFGPPLLFETMVFNKTGYDIYCTRYTTWDEAEKGHQEAVKWVKNGCKNND